jgi:RNA recognition motif-containing protein
VRENDSTGRNTSTVVEAKVVFVVNLVFDINEEELQKLFSQFGTVSGVRLMREKDGKSKGFAYIEFETEEAAQKALSMDKTLYRGRNLKVSISNPPKPRRERDAPAPANSLSLYISNLTPDVEPEDLTAQFSKVVTYDLHYFVSLYIRLVK